MSLTKEAALKFSNALDNMANYVQTNREALGLSPKSAQNFCLHCDLLSDHVEKQAGVSKKAELDPKENYTEDKLLPDEFNQAEIGMETDKPLLRNEDEPYMDAFRQQWFDELRTVQQTGQFSNAKVAAQAMVHMAGLLQKHNVPLRVK